MTKTWLRARSPLPTVAGRQEKGEGLRKGPWAPPPRKKIAPWIGLGGAASQKKRGLAGLGTVDFHGHAQTHIDSSVSERWRMDPGMHKVRMELTLGCDKGSRVGPLGTQDENRSPRLKAMLHRAEEKTQGAAIAQVRRSHAVRRPCGSGDLAHSRSSRIRRPFRYWTERLCQSFRLHLRPLRSSVALLVAATFTKLILVLTQNGYKDRKLYARLEDQKWN